MAAMLVSMFLGAAISGARADVGSDAKLDVGSIIALEWIAPEHDDCPGRDDVLSGIQRLIADAQGENVSPISVTAHVQRLGTRSYRVELLTRSRGVPGRRVIEERSCQAMGEATVVILAWMIAPEAMAARELPADPKRDPTERSQAPAQPEVAPRQHLGHQQPQQEILPRPRSRGPKGGVGTSAAADWGTLPKLALGAQVQASLQWPLVSGSVYGSFWPGRSYWISDSNVGGSLALWVLGSEVCARPFVPMVSGCVGPEINLMRGSGLGVSDRSRGSSAWLAIAAALDFRGPPAGLWTIHARAQAVVPKRHEQFGIDGVGIVAQPSTMAARASLGLTLQL